MQKSYYLPKQIIEHIKKIAEVKGRSESFILREIIEKFLVGENDF